MLNSEEVMNDLQSFVRNEVSNPKIGDACATALLDCFRLNFRNQQIYVPTQTKLKRELEQRNKAIMAAFTGHNQNELAVKFKLSVMTIYNIINEARRRKETGEKPLKPILLIVIDEYLPSDLIRAGLSEEKANSLGQKVADYLCDNYAGALFGMH